jgi:hypothetical protein
MHLLTKIGFLFLMLLIASCKKEKEEPVDFKYEYAPQTIGHYCIYDVMEVKHDDAVGMHDTTVYFLKERIESSFVDDQGRPSLRLERSRLDTASGLWVITDVWYSTRIASRYEKIEEDERFIRLTFPVKIDAEWNGNAYNQIGAWDYKYTDVDVARTYNGLNFSNTARVSHIDEFNFVQRYLSYEVYAKNIGLVSKYYKYVTIDAFDSTAIDVGNELYMNIVSYGVE